jgi:hypothetical protein
MAQEQQQEEITRAPDRACEALLLLLKDLAGVLQTWQSQQQQQQQQGQLEKFMRY